MRARPWLIAGFVVLLLTTASAVWFAPVGVRRAPDATLSIIDGRTLRLGDLRGRPLLVTFWATTCPECVREIPQLVRLYEELGPKGLEIIGIAMYYDPPNRVVAMTRHRQIPYPVALDITAEAAVAFGDVRLTPTNFLIAPDGRIIRETVGTFSPTEFAELRREIITMLEQPEV